MTKNNQLLMSRLRKNSIVLFSLSTLFFGGCGDNTTTTTDSKAVASLPIYSSLSAMLDSMNDFTEEDGTMKILAINPVHIQISSTFMPGESEKNMTDEALRDFVYTSLNVFSFTKIDSLTISSIPLVVDPETRKKTYQNNLLLTGFVKRQNAMKLLEETMPEKSLRDLYSLQYGTWVPSEGMDFHKTVDNGNAARAFATLTR